MNSPSAGLFGAYLKDSTSPTVTDAKTVLLTTGIRCDFDALGKLGIDLREKYKVETVAVSDRHFMSPDRYERRFIPDEIILSDGKNRSTVKAYYVEDSPFVFTVKDGKYVIENDHGVPLPFGVEIVPLPDFYKVQYGGKSVKKYVSVVGTDRISIIPYDGCENWVMGNQCKFCGADPSRLGFDGTKPNIAEIRSKHGGDSRRWWRESRDGLLKGISTGLDALEKCGKLEPHTHLMVMCGNLADVGLQWEIIGDTSEAIAHKLDLANIDSYLISAPPKSIDDIKRSKQYGFRSIVFNLECFDEELFRETCPGKDREYSLKMLRESIAVYGEGNVRTNFVLGIDPIETLLKGVEILASDGIISDYSVFFSRPAAAWSGRTPPNPQDIRYFTEELVKIYRRYNFKPFSCALSSRSSVASDVFESASGA